MWLKSRIKDGNLFGNTLALSVIFLWILLCSSEALGFQTEDDYKRYHSIPTFTSYSGNISFYVGDTANLSCVIKNLGARSVTWRKIPDISPINVGETIYKNHDERLSISHDSSRNNWDLIIRDLKLDDTGQYECQVPSSNKELRQHVFLRVKERAFEERTEPPAGKVITIAGPTLTHVGDEVIVNCSATFTGVASIDWFFEGYKLESNIEGGIVIKERYSGLSKTVHSTLTIKKASMSNAGMFTCRSADEYVQNFRLTVLSEVKTNNKKRVISDFVGTESSTSGQNSNTSSRVSNNRPIIILLMVTWLLISRIQR